MARGGGPCFPEVDVLEGAKLLLENLERLNVRAAGSAAH